MSIQAQARLFFALAAAVLAAGCAHLTSDWIAPGVNLVGIRPVEIAPDRQSFVVTLAVNNPNDVALPIEGASYSLAVEGTEIAAGSAALDALIPAHGEGAVDVEVEGDLMGFVQNAPAPDLLDGFWSYEITGELKLSGGLFPVPFRYAGEAEAAQLLGRLLY